MENTIKKPRERVVMYLCPDVLRRVRLHRLDTKKPVGRIVEEVLANHFEMTIHTETSNAKTTV